MEARYKQMRMSNKIFSRRSPFQEHLEIFLFRKFRRICLEMTRCLDIIKLLQVLTRKMSSKK